MQQSYKAALFAALVFPGSGHLLLKHFPAGILFAGTTLASGWIWALRHRAQRR